MVLNTILSQVGILGPIFLKLLAVDLKLAIRTSILMIYVLVTVEFSVVILMCVHGKVYAQANIIA